MREIKFRVKSRQTGQWTYFSIPSLDNEFPVESSRGSLYAWDTCGEYTKLKDQNGTEIYDGDIILYEGEALKDDQVTRYHYKDCLAVEFNQFIYDEIEFGRNGQGDVIGNIYENPELLNPDL